MERKIKKEGRTRRRGGDRKIEKDSTFRQSENSKSRITQMK